MSGRKLKMAILALGALALTFLTSACAEQSSTSVTPALTGTSSAEAVEASYLDISATIAEVRGRVGDWVKGDEQSVPLAQERLKRVDTLVVSVGWPAEMATAIAKTQAASGAMGKALREKDQAAAEVASKSLGDGSHDITHAFYGDWLPLTTGAPASPMAVHVGYLDLTLNNGDLRSRLNAWEKGDESGLNIAKEKTERIGIVVNRMLDYGLVTGPLKGISRELPFMAAALARKDLNAAKQTMVTIDQHMGDVNGGFEVWLGLAAGASDPACVQASYLELQRRSAAIQTSIANWRKGDDKSLNLAETELGRLEAAIAHPVWNDQMGATVDRLKLATAAARQAVTGKDQNAAESAAKMLNEASDNASYAYYAYWLPSGVLANTAGTMDAMAAGAAGHGDAHGAAPANGGTVANPGPNWLVVGGFGALMAAVIGAAWVLKRSMEAASAEPVGSGEPSAV